MMALNADRPAARMLWRGRSRSELPRETDGLHSIISTPMGVGDQLYGVGSYGELRGIDATNGERLWHSDAMNDQERWATACFVRHGDRHFVMNDTGAYPSPASLQTATRRSTALRCSSPHSARAAAPPAGGTTGPSCRPIPRSRIDTWSSGTTARSSAPRSRPPTTDLTAGPDVPPRMMPVAASGPRAATSGRAPPLRVRSV